MDTNGIRSRIWGIALIVALVAIAGYFAWKEYKPEESSEYPDFKQAQEDVPGFLRGKTEQNLPQAPIRE